MPPKRRGRKGLKFSKLSDEQKQKFLEKRTAMEEEQRRRREELVSIFLKIKARKEEEMSRTNTFKLNDRWRTVMRGLKSKELADELTTLQRTVERRLEDREETIRRLVRELEESDEQHSIAIRTQIHLLDQMIGQHRGHLAELRGWFDAELADLVGRGQRTADRWRQVQAAGEDRLSAALQKLELHGRDTDRERATQLMTKREQLRQENMEEREQLKLTLETAMEQLWIQFRKTILGYYQETEARRKVYRELMARDQSAVSLITAQNNRIEQLQEQIAELRMRLTEEARQHERGVSGQRAELETMAQRTRAAKQALARHQQLHTDRIKQLTAVSADVIQGLEERERLAQKVLRLADCCQKLEAEDPLVLPDSVWPGQMDGLDDFCFTDEEQQLLQEAQQAPAQQPLAKVVDECRGLEGFWRRLNAAELDCAALQLQRNDLRRENRQLQQALKQYLSSGSQQPALLPQCEPQVTPVGAPSVRAGAGAGAAAVSVVEAAHIARYTLQ